MTSSSNSDDDASYADGLSSLQAGIILSNSIMGSGLLAMGFVFRCAGFWSFLIISAIAAFSAYSGNNIVDMLYYDETDKKKRLHGYVDIGEQLSTSFGRKLSNLINLVVNFCLSILVLLLSGGLLHSIAPTASPNTWTLLCSLAILPTLFVQRMKTLYYVSLISVVLTTLLSLEVSYYGLNFNKQYFKNIRGSFHRKIDSLSIGFGITIMTFTSTPYVALVEKVMLRPKEFTRVFNRANILVTILKLCTGAMTYMAFGKSTTTMMPMQLPEGWIRIAAVVSTSIAAVSYVTLPIYAIFDMMEHSFPKILLVGNQTEPSAGLLLCCRTVLLVTVIVLAIITPHFSLITAFIAAFLGNILVFILPAVFVLLLKFSEIGRLEIVINILVVVVFSFWGLVGTIYSAIIIRKVLHGSELNNASILEL